MTLPITVRSGITPDSSWAPPVETRKPLMTSSKTSSAPLSVASSRSSSRKPGLRRDEAHVGRVGLGQDRGGLRAARPRRVIASGSFQGTTMVAAAAASGTPGEAGMPWVASPEPASASRPSTWPW